MKRSTSSANALAAAAALPPPTPTEAQTAVVKLDPSRASRSTNMVRYANAALDLIAHMQTKR